MDLTPVSKHQNKANLSAQKVALPVGRDQSGIALFMVLSSVAMLAILVSEFTYISQIGQMIAFGGMDQTKAHYIAKGAFKLSLLRLKAYQKANSYLSSLGAAGPKISRNLLNKIWSFPVFYPLPTNIPGMSAVEKGMIEKFQKESDLDGRYSALIESESSKYNLNLLLPGFAPLPSGTPSAVPSGQPSPDPPPSYTPEGARKSLYDYMGTVLKQKIESDDDFALTYRDLKLEDLTDQIYGWVDRRYESRTGQGSRDRMAVKRAPIYSVGELHMLPAFDDELFKLFTPHFSASGPAGININSMKSDILRALVPQMTKDEAEAFFKFRDSEERENQFATQDDFFKYLLEKVAAFKGNQSALDNLRKEHAARGIFFVTEETEFKITVQSQVNSATRTIEAWVSLTEPAPTPSTLPGQPQQQGTSTTAQQLNEAGIRVNYMTMR